MPKLKMIFFYAMLAVFAAGLLLLGYVLYEADPDSFQRRFAELLLQLSLVAVIGGVVKLLIDWGAKINSRFRASREQKIDFLRRVQNISARLNYAQDLLNAHNSGKTYGERLREIILMRGEITEIVEDLKANRNLFEEQSEIERALCEINKYLNRGREEYIKCHDKVDADAKKGRKIQTSIEQLNMKWTKDFMDSGEDYSKNLYGELFESKGKMREQVYGTS